MKYIEIMTIDEVSKRSRLTISTIRKDVKEGKLKSLPGSLEFDIWISRLEIP